MQEPSLDLVGLIDGTDKSSLKHDYLRHYEAAFAPLRNEPITLLEIGVLNGSSVKTWEKYFPKAHIVGVDINEKCLQYASERITIEIGSQNDGAFLDHLADKYDPTIIIDDGSHIAEHIIFSFQKLFPGLRANGHYVVEDMHFHLGDRAQAQRGNSDIGPAEYFQPIYTALLASWLDKGAPDNQRYMFETIDTMKIAPRILFIRKKADFSEEETEHLIHTAQELVTEVGSAGAYDRLAGLMITHKRSWERAEVAARKAIELDASVADYHHRLSVILRRQRKQAESIDAAKRAVEINPRNALFFNQLGTLYFEAGRPGEAIDIFRHAISANPRQPGFRERLADALMETGDLNAAVNEMEKAAQMMVGGPRHPGAIRKLSMMHEALSKKASVS